ncbi:DUF134 domain-containing protein [Carboxylicivirga sediminis]|uniref:UPF0251 protein KDU71_09700 n=1 Tax=Carboxylicivirga sediminis TaxID=2006564 RepID=A0A941IXR2_9BACT|nr:DUF134 domain-containing protein [Carboxylicivirga sediminis]MBR8535828.1 DUF134 domain-containing protein [Carboxylicivirga sediminis]
MPRPKRKRFIESPPKVDGFKPLGVPLRDIEPIILLYEEYEAMRLTDYEGLHQEEAASKMNVSRPTFTRIYEQARQSVAKAFVEGKVIMIEGGDFHSNDYWYKCIECQKLNISKHALDNCIYCQAGNLRTLN